MNENTSEDTSTNETTTAIEPQPIGFINYLKKFLRGMPLGVCREIFGVHEVRFTRDLERGTKAGTLSEETQAEYRELLAAFCRAIDIVDTAIAEHGRETRIGDCGDYNEDEAAGLWLAATGWTR